MLTFILELPQELLLIITLVIILPCLFTIFLRTILYQKLVFLESRVRRLINHDQRGNQPEIIQQLELRFEAASSEIDQVNTVALIEQVYSQQKIGFVSYNQIEYICRVIPNLLLAFGLLGTFLGITLNLSELSQTLSDVTQDNTTNIDNLLQELQKPLEAMGIAFTTSLTGIFFSAVITLFNLIKNTSIGKYKLIVAIEDYLDNIYLSQVQGNNRLDKAVDRLVDEFKGFLSRFGTTVRDAVESSLGAKIQEIVDVNKQANELACRVYSGFQESAGTLSKSVDDFQSSTLKFAETSQVFEQSNFARLLADATKDLYSIQKNFNSSTEALAKSASTIDSALIEVVNSNQKLQNIADEIAQNNQNTVQVLELHRSNQQAMSEIIPDLYRGGKSFQSAIEILDRLQQKTLDKADSFEQVEVELKGLIGSINKYNQVVTVGLKNLSDRLITTMDNQTENNKQQLQSISDKLQKCNNHLNDTKHESYRLSKVLEKQFNSNLPSQNSSQYVTNTAAKK